MKELTHQQILVWRCKVLANLATTLMAVQTSAATTKGLRLISEELDSIAAEISRRSSEAFEVVRCVTPEQRYAWGVRQTLLWIAEMSEEELDEVPLSVLLRER